jgi:hypothetical protein
MWKCEPESGSRFETESGGRAAGRAAALLAVVASLLLPAPEARADWTLGLEGGAAWCGSNDVAIPGDTGTRFSLTRDLEAEAGGFWRARLGLRLAPRHAVSILAAPLTLHAAGGRLAPLGGRGEPPAARPLRRASDECASRLRRRNGGPQPAVRRFSLSPADPGRGLSIPPAAMCRTRSASP